MTSLTSEQEVETLIWALKQPKFWLSINTADQMMAVEAKGTVVGQTQHVFSGSYRSQIAQLHALRIAERLDPPASTLPIHDPTAKVPIHTPLNSSGRTIFNRKTKLYIS